MPKNQAEKEHLERIVVWPDTHAPYHDKRAVELVLHVMDKLLFSKTILIGDFIDYDSVSPHLKNLEYENKLEKELSSAAAILRKIEVRCPGEKFYIYGNHEDFLRRYIAGQAPALYHLVDELKYLGISEDKWKVIPYKKDMKVGRVYFTHDVGSTGANAVQAAMNAYQDNVVTGHTHRIKYIVEGNAKGVSHVSASFGWLGDVTKVDYMHQIKARRDWALGFGVGYLRSNGFVYLQPVPIVDYTCVVEGRLFSV